MPRIADVLERESRTVDLEQGDFERLLGRRERKERNRRIRAGAVGVIVALAAGIFLVRSLTSDPTPANPPEPRPAPAAAGTLAYIARRRRLRRRSGRVERGEDRGRPRRPLRRRPCRRVVLGGGIDVVAGRAVPRLSRLGLLEPGLPAERRDQRRGGQRARDDPDRDRMGHRVGARLHTLAVWDSFVRRSASTGSTASADAAPPGWSPTRSRSGVDAGRHRGDG